MSVTGGGAIFIFEQDYGFTYRGLWTTTDTYTQGDVVYYGTPQTAYLANTAIAANVIPTTQNSGWSRLAQRGLDGGAGPEGRYTILLFARSATEPRAPNNTDATFPADPANFSSTVWTRAAIPSGTETLWMSFIRVRPGSSALNFGEVTRITGEAGTDGVNAEIEFSDNQSGPWSTSSSPGTEYIRLRVGTGTWSDAVRIKGEDGAPGESAQMQFSPDGTGSWVTQARSTDNFIRFRIGNTGMWTMPFRFRGIDGDPGASVAIQFSPDNITWHGGNPTPNDKYIRFIVGSSPPSTGIEFVGRDGTDGDDSLQVQYNSSNTPATFHNDLRSNDDWIRFRVGTSDWSIARQFVGQAGASAPNVQIEFSQDANRWENTARSGDLYIRFSSDNGNSWTNAARFVGEAGAGGESVSIEYSIDGQTAWHANLNAADYFIRLQIGTRGWSTAVRFRAYPLMIQYSIDGSTLWHTGFVSGTDKFIRFSNDNGVTWTDGDRFVGEDGTDGDDTLEVQYSTDNSNWSNTLTAGTLYIRFRTGGTGPWSTSSRFVGWTGGFLDTFFQRRATTPLGPLNLEYHWDTGSYRNLGNGWNVNVPTGTDQLWKVQYWVPPRDGTTEVVRPTLRGAIYSEDGTDGDDGRDGDSIRIIYQRKTGSPPATPTGGTWNGTAYTEPSGWSLTPPVGTARLYGSIVALSGTDRTNAGITYTTVLELEAVDGIDGGSIDFVYRRSATALTVPPSNTGITATGGVLDNVPSGWSLTIPGGTDPLYASIVTITSTISFAEPIRLTGSDGAPGRNGLSEVSVWTRNASRPSVPTALVFNQDTTLNTDTAGGLTWHRDPASASGTDQLWESLVLLDTSVDPPTETWQGSPIMSGPGADGTDGDSIRTIYRRDESEPTQPANGTGTWNGSDYDPPSGWHESIPVGTDDLYTCIVHLSGSDKTNSGITYDQLIRWTPRDGRDGVPTIPSTVDEVRFQFTADTSDQNLATTRTTNTDAWTRGYRDIQAFMGGTDGIATQDSTGITLVEAGIYSLVVQIDLQVVTNRFHSEVGFILHVEDADGTRIDDFIFFVEDLADPISNETFPAYGSTPPISLPAGAKVFIRLFYQGVSRSTSLNLSQNLVHRIITPEEDDDRVVVRRYRGSAGSGGTGTGTSGSSIDVIYRRSATTLTVSPTGGTALAGQVRTAPPGWSTTIPSGTDTLYTSIAHIDAANNVYYDEPVQWTGKNGLSEVSVWTRHTSRPGVPTALVFNQDTTLNINTAGGLTWHTSPASASGNDQLWRASVQLDTSVNPPTETWLGSPIEDGVGSDGDDGDSVRYIYRRDSSRPSTPTGGTWNGSDYDPPSGWFESEPSGNDPLYSSVVSLSGTNKTNSGISYSATFKMTGEDGSRGVRGYSTGIAYRHSVNTITAPPTGGTAVDGLLTAAPSGWQLTYPGVSQVTWASIAIIDGSTISAWSNPIRLSGAAGPAGEDGFSTTFYYLRTSTNTAPNRASITYNGNAFSNLGSWVPFESSTGDRTANPYLWLTIILYRVGVSGSQQVTVPFLFGGLPSNVPGPASTVPGPAGFGYQYFYHANTANTVSLPAINYNGTTFNTIQSGWAITVPTTPVGANIFKAPVRYQVGIAGQTVEGVILDGNVPGAVTPPPPTSMSYSSGIEYGIAAGNTPSATHRDSDAFSLAVGGTHTTEALEFGPTTASNDDIYIRLPAGLVLTRAVDQIQGEETSAWIRVGSTQVWTSVIGFAQAEPVWTFTVRRDS